MLMKKTNHGYSVQRKYVQGQGFVDSIRPILQNIGAFASQNKDLIAKPLLGAVGELAAFGLTQGSKALLSKIMKNKKSDEKTPILDPKGEEILQNILNNNVSNIIGSGIKQF